MPETPLALPWKIRLFTAAISALTDAVRRRDGTVNRRLLSLFDLKARPNPNPVDGVSTADYTVDPARPLSVRLFSPSSASSSSSPLPVIVYFHGGGFAFHSAVSRPYDALCRRIARGVPAAVVSVEYRLAPEHRCPAPYDDGLDVLRWIDGRVDLFPDVAAVFVSGDSAGGNISHHVARRAAATSFDRVILSGVVLLQPFFGGEGRTDSETRLAGVPFGSNERFDWMWRTFLPAGSDRDHEAANVFGPRSNGGGDFSGFPSTMVFVGGCDMLLDRQLAYVEGLRGKGVDVSLAEYQNAIHGFYVFLELPEAERVITDIRDFVLKQLGKEV